MKRHKFAEPIAFSVERGGNIYPATYVVSGGRVTVAYSSPGGRRTEKSAPVGVDGLITARMLLRELVLEITQQKK